MVEFTHGVMGPTCGSADGVLENFKPGTMGKYGLDYAALSQTNPQRIDVSHKGF